MKYDDSEDFLWTDREDRHDDMRFRGYVYVTTADMMYTNAVA